jgi:hypothetical protein
MNDLIDVSTSSESNIDDAKATKWWVMVAVMNVRCMLPGALEVGFDGGEGWDTLPKNTIRILHGP